MLLDATALLVLLNANTPAPAQIPDAHEKSGCFSDLTH